jgi:hypothetical protein
MSQMAYFSGYTQKYLFLTFILFSWMYCGGGFTGKICFSISFSGWIFLYPLIYAKQHILTCDLNNTNTLQYLYPQLMNLFFRGIGIFCVGGVSGGTSGSGSVWQF